MLFSRASPLFFVIHLCNEDAAQLTSPMELNKRVIIQSSLAPKRLEYPRFPVIIMGKSTAPIIN